MATAAAFALLPVVVVVVVVFIVGTSAGRLRLRWRFLLLLTGALLLLLPLDLGWCCFLFSLLCLSATFDANKVHGVSRAHSELKVSLPNHGGRTILAEAEALPCMHILVKVRWMPVTIKLNLRHHYIVIGTCDNVGRFNAGRFLRMDLIF